MTTRVSLTLCSSQRTRCTTLGYSNTIINWCHLVKNLNNHLRQIIFILECINIQPMPIFSLK